MSRTRWKNTSVAVAGVALLALGTAKRQELGDWFLGRGGDEHADEAHYTCPMDPSVRAEQPGKCPICGMALTPVTQEQQATDVLHVPTESMRRIGLRFAAAEKRGLRRRVLAYGEIVEPAAGSAKGTPLATVAAEAYSGDPSAVEIGQPVAVVLPAVPLHTFEGSVIESTVDAEAKTTRLRATIADPGRLVQKGMAAEVQVEGKVVERMVVPSSAILPLGKRRIALVDRGRERIEPRHLRTGIESDGVTEVISGLALGERVVVSGNFLIAAESRIRSASTLWAEATPVSKPPSLNRTSPVDARTGVKSAPGAQQGAGVQQGADAQPGAGAQPAPGVQPGAGAQPAPGAQPGAGAQPAPVKRGKAAKQDRATPTAESKGGGR